MALDRRTIPGEFQEEQVRETSSSELVERLIDFDGPPEAFLVNLLSLQCSLVGASGAAILVLGREGRVEPMAVFPRLKEDADPPQWLRRSAEKTPDTVKSGKKDIIPNYSESDLYGQPARQSIVLVPLRLEEGPKGVSAFLVDYNDPSSMDIIAERLELTTSLLSLYSYRQRLQRRQSDMIRLRSSLGLLANVNEQKHFDGAAMAFCNEVASTWQAERAGLGMLEGRYVKLKALSHTEKFNRKMDLVQKVESAMEECLDQDTEILYPESEGASYVSRATRELALDGGKYEVLSLPLRKEGECIGVLTVERTADNSFTLDEAETLRLTCDLCAARLADLHEYDKWFGAKAAGALRKVFAAVVGPKHTWWKIAGVLVAAFLAFAIFAKGDYTANGDFEIRPVESRVIAAPYEGMLEAVHVLPGDEVEKGQLLAVLDTDELEKELTAALSDQVEYEKQMVSARQRGRLDEAEIAKARLRGTGAKIDLLRFRIDNSEIKAPLSGEILSGDWERNEGQMLKHGTELFRIAPTESEFEVDIFLPEDQIAGVSVDQEGELALEACPGDYMTFHVTHIVPVAEVKNEKNVFRVTARLEELPEDIELRPGLSGMAKVKIGRRSYGWIWTRQLINWIRMKLWI